MCNTTPKTKFPFSCPVAIRPTSIKQIPSKKNSRSMRRILEEDDDDASKKRAVHSGAGGNSVWNRRTKSTSDQPKRAIALIVVNMISILAVFLNPVRQIIWRWIGCVLEVVVGCWVSNFLLFCFPPFRIPFLHRASKRYYVWKEYSHVDQRSKQ